MHNRISSHDKSLSLSCNGKQRLSIGHRNELQASGLTDDTIAKAGIYTESNPDTIASLLGNPAYLNGHLQNSSAMVIPFGYDDFARVKLSDPRLRNGKPIKYESPLGSIQHAYFPPDVQDEVTQRDDPREVFIVEGEKKALKLWQDLRENDVDGHVIGLTGVWGWKKKQREELIDWLDAIHWMNREVFICFDNDVHWNKQVSDARRRLAKVLKVKGANVKSIDIPINDPTQKYGVDDYLCRFGFNAFDKCLSDAKEIDTTQIDLSFLQSLVRLSDVQEEPVTFWMDDFVPNGELILIDGPPGCGKSAMLCDFAARASVGRLPPYADGEIVTHTLKGDREPINILLLSPEEHAGKYTKARIKAYGGDESRVMVINPNSEHYVTITSNIEMLDWFMAEHEIGLVLIDQIFSVLTGFDAHKDMDSREALHPIIWLARKFDSPFIATRHNTKSSGNQDTVAKGGGSIAFSGVSRAQLCIGQKGDLYFLFPSKVNVAGKTPSLTYQVTGNGGASHIKWVDVDYSINSQDVSHNITEYDTQVFEALRTALGDKKCATRHLHVHAGMNKQKVADAVCRLVHSGKMIRERGKGTTIFYSIHPDFQKKKAIVRKRPRPQASPDRPRGHS